MMTIRLERRNYENRVTTTMEKDFDYVHHTGIARWVKDELVGALHAGDTITIKRIPNE
jgi:hypothetical protein